MKHIIRSADDAVPVTGSEPRPEAENAATRRAFFKGGSTAAAAAAATGGLLGQAQAQTVAKPNSIEPTGFPKAGLGTVRDALLRKRAFGALLPLAG